MSTIRLSPDNTLLMHELAFFRSSFDYGDRAIIVFSEGGHGAWNLHFTPFFLRQVVVWWCVCTVFTISFNSDLDLESGKVHMLHICQ